jgi:hypothetical protein
MKKLDVNDLEWDSERHGERKKVQGEQAAFGR